MPARGAIAGDPVLMDWTHTRKRFAFLAEALEGVGGFAPVTSWAVVSAGDTTTTPPTPARQGYLLHSGSHLVRYPRESDEKYAARNALALYENHLAEAVDRFVGFLSRKSPSRLDADGPLTELMLADADMRGNSLDEFMAAFAYQARARGSMLLVIDKPEEAPPTLADQIRQRAVPYLRMCEPERVTDFSIDPASGLFLSVSFESEEVDDGKLKTLVRTYTKDGWSIADDRGNVLRSGLHAFRACPVLAFTENGGLFPQVGVYAQVADLSRAIFNTRSEHDEILRSQTFSLLHVHVPPEHLATFSAARTAATIGTHSMLVHTGDAPGFIAPDSGPADVYMRKLQKLEDSIKRITKDDASGQAMTQAESGEAKRRRFEELNAQLARFARSMRSLEMRMWELFHRDTGTPMRLRVEWPTDFNLADVVAELDILSGMQSGGFPPVVLAEKRASIAAQEFDAADDETRSRVLAAIREQAQQPTRSTPGGQSANT